MNRNAWLLLAALLPVTGADEASAQPPPSEPAPEGTPAEPSTDSESATNPRARENAPTPRGADRRLRDERFDDGDLWGVARYRFNRLTDFPVDREGNRHGRES